mmetsp:Transcript_42706/g.80038  ORF Transcript_42706/g.80038 Transcript_42706/m.80038 type:complete len:116 (-) Transcript_42706:8-355(-)
MIRAILDLSCVGTGYTFDCQERRFPSQPGNVSSIKWQFWLSLSCTLDVLLLTTNASMCEVLLIAIPVGDLLGAAFGNIEGKVGDAKNVKHSTICTCNTSHERTAPYKIMVSALSS